jgi:1,4-alpha-glucan branching enzyme
VLKKRFFKTKSDCEVAFELTPTRAEQVELVCEVNGWEPIEMKRNKNGTFRTRVRLPREQQYEFRYRIDSRTWVNDEAADGYCINRFGGENGILDTTSDA